LNSLFLGYDALERPLHLDGGDRRIHMHVIGASGSGKSKFLEWIIRQDIENRQGFCLIDPHGDLYRDIVNYSAHHPLLTRELGIILLDPSTPGEPVVGFNPFQRLDGDVSVQVDRRIDATLRAWGVENTDQTPTLERTLRLIYTVMLEKNLGLPQVQHLIDFKAREIRAHLIKKLRTPLIEKEWEELQELKAREWRDEVLSAKNRLFKFLTSAALRRFMGVPGRTIDLVDVMDKGKILLVNLAPNSTHFSRANARVFGALLVNEFYESAMRRKKNIFGERQPYYLYVDEFQNFVSLDIDDMLDQTRKFGVFLILAHQRFRQLDENLLDAVLTNCRLKAVFGGLPAASAKVMAEELFIDQLDPLKIKVAIEQTKFWPEYRRDQVYTRGSAHGTSSTSMESSVAAALSASGAGTSYFMPQDWFGSFQPAGTSITSSSATNQASARGSSWGASDSYNEAVADIPTLFPVPFKELSSIQYYSQDEQLNQLVGALKGQFQRHCFIQLPAEKTQPMLVPRVEDFYTSSAGIDSYKAKQTARNGGLSATEVDALIASQENALQQAVEADAASESPADDEAVVGQAHFGQTANAGKKSGEQRPIPGWDRAGQGHAAGKTKPDFRTAALRESRPKRGPKTDLANHEKLAKIVSAYGPLWKEPENLLEICEQLDKEGVPIPDKWPTRKRPARSWTRQLEIDPHLVKETIISRCKAAGHPVR